MPGGYKNINGKDGNNFSSSNQPKNRGRKKKIYTILKEKGYCSEDIKTAFGELAFYTISELKKVYDDESKPIIIRIISNQFFQALKKSDWTKIKEILEHVIGKPVQHTDLTSKGNEINNEKNNFFFTSDDFEEEY